MYKCDVCAEPSEAGEPMLKHAVLRKDKSIEREVKVCKDCAVLLGVGGLTPEQLKKRYQSTVLPPVKKPVFV